jgi:hypothetical protein
MNKKGQGLVEALIALGAAVVIISAITVAVVTAVNNSDYSKSQNLATGYAQQGMEIVKQDSQLDWVSLQASISASTVWCLPQGSTDFSPVLPCTVNIGERFVRQLDFDLPLSTCTGNGIHRVTVTVKWTDGKCSSSLDYCHKVVLDSCIADIYRNK